MSRVNGESSRRSDPDERNASLTPRTDRRPPLLGVVLAGGRSSRMGRDKAWLVHPSGGTFLQRALDLLRPLCEGIAVSAAANSDIARRSTGGTGSMADVAVLVDPVAGLGPAVGVATAVEAAARRALAAALVIPVDMPEIGAAHLRALIAAHRHAPTRLVAASFGDAGCCEPLLAIYPVRYAMPLRRLVASEHRSLSRWLGEQNVQRVVLPSTAAANVNTPAELADWDRQPHRETS